MLLDNTLVFSEAQAVTASAASTNIVDQKAAGDAYGALWVVAKVVDADFATLTSLTVGVQTDSASNFSSAVTLASSGAIAAAALTEGEFICCFRLPADCKRYIRLYYTVGGSNATAGKVTAFLTAAAPIGNLK